MTGLPPPSAEAYAFKPHFTNNSRTFASFYAYFISPHSIRAEHIYVSEAFYKLLAFHTQGLYRRYRLSTQTWPLTCALREAGDV
jgi:hypothetical protein